MTSEDLKAVKADANQFLTEQLSKLDEEQKEKLSYLLLGATMCGALVKPKEQA